MTARATATATAMGCRTMVAGAASFCLVLWGCAAGDASRAATFTVRDSAGVEIVESAEPIWREGEGWRLSAEPILDIGRTDGEAPYLLDRVMGVVRLDDGGVVVANMGDNTLRFFDAQGTFVRSVGRSGRGPGEFAQIMSLRRAGDALYAGQWGQHPTHVYDLAGEHLRSVVPAAELDISTSSIGVLDDGTQVYISWPQGRSVQQTGLWVEDLAIYRVSPDGAEFDSLIARPAMRFSLLQGRLGNGVVFGPAGSVVAAGDRIHYAFREAYEVEALDRDGSLRRVIRRASTPVPVTEQDIAEYKDALINAGAEGGGPVPPRLVEWRKTLAEESIYAEHHPAFRAMMVARTGGLWVERFRAEHTHVAGRFNQTYAEPTEYDVFDTRGVWLGVVTTPPHFRVLEIGEDYVAGVWRDENDIEHVRVYALKKQ